MRKNGDEASCLKDTRTLEERKVVLMLSRVCSGASVLAVFGFGSISILSSACTETDVDPIVAAAKQPATSAPLSQGGPMDVLFVVDDSSSMADKQQYLGEAASSFLNRLASPSCVDANHNAIGASVNGSCTSGSLAYPPVTDIHVGIVSTSLGLGAPDDPSAGGNPGTCANFHAHLVSGFVNEKQPTLDPKTQVFSWTKGQDIAQLAKDVSASVVGMGESGCGIEQQLESWYRFLIQPDPYQSLAWAGGSFQSVTYQGTDDDLLAQRKAFLRPNSTVAVVMLTDENDSSIDPLSLSGTGFNLLTPTFIPPNPTSTCATDPTSLACTSCAFVSASTDMNCAQLPQNGSPDDHLNTRFFHVKQLTGVDPQYPVSRYSNGLSNARVPDRVHEHLTLPVTGDLGYVGEPSCDNPLFAASLPSSSSEDVCHLPHGTRTASQIFFTVIAGVPHQLLQQDALDANSPLKSNLSPADYRTLLGEDPLAYRFDGVDVHMLESLTPRAGIPAGDAIVLGDWNTKGLELERACTFLLPQPIDEHAIDGECRTSDGDDNDDTQGDPICKPDGSQTQLYASATPAVRELSVARALGNQAIVSSICPIHLQIDSADAGTTSSPAISNTTQDPLFGYEPATNQLIARMAGN